MQLECNGQVCESYRERERAGEQLRSGETIWGRICKRVFGIAAPASGSPLKPFCTCCIMDMVVVVRVRVLQRVQTGDWPHQQTSSYMYAHPTARPAARGPRRRGRAGVENESAEVSAASPSTTMMTIAREIFHLELDRILHPYRLYILHEPSSRRYAVRRVRISRDPRHQRLRRAASL